MYRLLIVNPVTGVSERGLAERKIFVSSFLDGEWEVEFSVLPQGPRSIETREEKALAAAEVVRFVRRLEEAGSEAPPDAMLVWCASDPGVKEARELTSIPVVGPGESAMHLATMLGGRFSYLTPLQTAVPRTREAVEALGFGHRLASVLPIGLPVLELRRDVDATVERIVALGRRAVEEDGAGGLVLGCMGLFGVAERCSEKLGVPVIDPVVAGGLVVAALVRGRMSFSTVTFGAPARARSVV